MSSDVTMTSCLLLKAGAPDEPPKKSGLDGPPEPLDGPLKKSGLEGSPDPPMVPRNMSGLEVPRELPLVPSPPPWCR